jgi:hypothetical protein
VFEMEAAWTSETFVSYDSITRRHPEDGGSMDLRNVGILPQHYTASHPEDPDLDVDLVWSFMFLIWTKIWIIQTHKMCYKR